MKDNKVIDKTLGIDYSHLIQIKDQNTEVISDEEISQEELPIIQSFLEANKDIKPYIEKAAFDPEAAIAKHIINLCKDRNYTVKVNDTEYRLPLAIMIKAMSDCYNYVVSVAKALAEARGDRSKIQLSDSAVFEIAENYFRHGGSKIDISITNKTEQKKDQKKEKKKPEAEPKKEDLPEEVKQPEPEKEDSKQISFFDL